MNGVWLSNRAQGKRHMDGENMTVSANDVASGDRSGSGSGRSSRRVMMAAGAGLGSSLLALLASCAGYGSGGAGPDAPWALDVLMTQTINDIVNGKVAAGTALRDAAAKVNACLARA